VNVVAREMPPGPSPSMDPGSEIEVQSGNGQNMLVYITDNLIG
jgi:hypothetical protein